MEGRCGRILPTGNRVWIQEENIVNKWRGEEKGEVLQRGKKVRLDVFKIYLISIQCPHPVMLGIRGDNVDVIFTVAFVKLRIPHFNLSRLFLFLSSNHRDFTWFSFE